MIDSHMALGQREKVEEFRRRHHVGLLTLLFTDVAGSTNLKQTLGDSRAVPLIQQHHAAIRETLGLFEEGEEIETAGDSFFIIFTKPSDAVKFSLLVQARLRMLAAESGQPVLDRIGIHVGEVTIEEPGGTGQKRDLYGLQIDTCARVQSLGAGDQILLTRFAFDSARQVLKGDEVAGQISWLNHGPYVLKGVDEPVEVCEVGEIGKAVLAPPGDSEKAHRFLSTDAEQVPGWRPAVDQPVPGTSWVLEKKLGEGGFGEVWLGRDKVLKTRHVFKFCFHADRVRSLKREVTLFRLLKEHVGAHPNIVGVEATYFDEPPFYIVVQYVDGTDLPGWCETLGGIERVPLSARLEIVAQTADALQAAHDSGVIHRDVKPANILVGGSVGAGVHVHLTDFGIGQVASEKALAGVTGAGFTQTMMEAGSSQSGTHLYMAPELFAGRAASIRSDIYGLGVVLYQLLTGDFKRPVTTDWARKITDPLLREDLEKCFAGDPQERFAGAEQLARRLRTLEQRRTALAEQQALARQRERAAYRRGMMRTAAAAAAVVAAVALLAIYAFRQRSAEQTQRHKAEDQTRNAEAAATQARENLSQSDFLQALRSIDENRGPDALAQLIRSLAANPRNGAAISRLTTLLLYHSFALPVLGLKHGDSVRSAQFSPDGKQIVTASDDNTARVWDAQSGKPATGPLKHGDKVVSAQFSPDGKQIVTASDDNTARVWDAQSGKPVTDPLKHGDKVVSAQFSPDGKQVVTASWDNTARVWDAQSGQPVTGPLRHAFKVWSAQFSPDGTRIVTASWDKTARVWDAQSGKPVSGPLKHEEAVHAAQFSPDGKRVATVSWDRTARIWDVQSGLPATGPMKHGDAVRSVQFSPDGKRILTASDDKTARVWDAQSGRMLTRPMKHDGWVGSAKFSPDGKRIVTVSDDKTARVWDAQSGLPLTEPLKHDGWVGSAQFSPDGNRIVTVSDDKTARVWNVQSGLPLTEPLRHGDAVRSAHFSPDGKQVVTSSEDKTVRLWDVQSGQPLTAPMKHDDSVKSARFSPDGTRIVTASRDKTARVWDAHSGREVTDHLKHDGFVLSAHFSPDGKRIVTGAEDNTARVWDAESGRPLTGPLEHAEMVVSAQFSPDGRRVVTASWDKTARVWDAQSGQPLTGPLKHGDKVVSAQFSPDGKRVVTASWDKTSRVWDAQSGQPLTEPLKQGEAVRSAQFSFDGKRIVTASWAKTVRIWDAQSGQPLTEPLRLGDVVRSAQFSPDGERIVTASDDMTARVWDTQSGRPLTDAFKHADKVASAQFSPDGKRIVTASEDSTARVWDISPGVGPAPEWLSTLAEAVAGQHLNDRGIFEPPGEDPIRALETVRAQLSRAPADDSWAIFGRWFLADRSTRTISPFSKVTIPQYIENRIKENTPESLEEAERLATGNAELLKRIAGARQALEKKANEASQ